MGEKSHTRSLMISILVPVVYAVVFMIFGAVALAADGSEYYTALIGIASFMLVAGPLVLLICGIVGNVHGALALRDREHKGKAVALLSVSALYTAGSVAAAVLLVLGLLA